ncbi:MAG: DUF547 domain-containing protein [Melioribacteraceae bacterium]|nr:DUF547 domain-containing protein [Melioribacteraceae bacterium]
MRKYFISVIVIILFYTNSYSQDHQLFTEILQDYVKYGLVDYKNLEDDKRLAQYLDQLSVVNPGDLSKKEQLAFWINVYNAFTLKIICDNYPLGSITDLHTGGRIIGHILGQTVWDKEYIKINGSEYNLNEIEHEILRKMDEPRIHFAIVCASISCPELRNEAFEADKLEIQLEEQTQRFINDPSRNSFDLGNREAEISEIFNWFDEDFGDSEEEVLIFISDYLTDEIASEIKDNFSEWDISYMDYDWGLNEYKD